MEVEKQQTPKSTDGTKGNDNGNDTGTRKDKGSNQEAKAVGGREAKTETNLEREMLEAFKRTGMKLRRTPPLTTKWASGHTGKSGSRGEFVYTLSTEQE